MRIGEDSGIRNSSPNPAFTTEWSPSRKVARHGACAHCLLSPDFNLAGLVGYYVRLADGQVFLPNVDDDLTGCLEYEEDWVEEDQDYVDAKLASDFISNEEFMLAMPRAESSDLAMASRMTRLS